MKQPIFTGAAVAIVTPMHADGTVNYEKLGSFLDFQIRNGTDAVVICGTTGESSTLSHEEHVEAVRYTVKKVAGRIPVIAGTGSNDTAYAVKLSLEAQSAGVDAILCVTPYYNKTSQAGLIRHYTYIADRVDCPMILYNVPSRTGVNIKPETYLELSKHPRIVAAKEANGDITSVARTASLCGDDLVIYSGNDDQIVPLLSLGGKGVISVLSNVMPREAHDICARYLSGDAEGSRRLQLELIPLIDALFMAVSPIPVKAALNLMGFDMGPCRLPLTDLSEQETAALKVQLKKYGLLDKVLA